MRILAQLKKLLIAVALILCSHNINAADLKEIRVIDPNLLKFEKSAKELKYSIQVTQENGAADKYFLTPAAKKIIIDFPEAKWKIKSSQLRKGIGLKPVRRLYFQNLKKRTARLIIELYYSCYFNHSISDDGFFNISINRSKQAAAVLAAKTEKSVAPNKKAEKNETKMISNSDITDKTETDDISPAKEENLVSLDFKDADLKNVLRLLSESGGVNIVAGDNTQGKVTISMKKVKFFTALESILKVNGYSYIYENNIVKVIPSQIMSDMPENYSTQIFKLQIARAEDLVKPVRSTLSPRANVEILSSSNSLMITDQKDYMDKARAAIRYLDSKEMWDANQQQDGIRTKIEDIKVIKLKYLKAANVKAIVVKFLPENQGIIEFDESVNSLVLSGGKKFVKQAVELIDKMDIATKTEMENSVTKIFSIKNAKAEEIREAVEKIFSAQTALSINKENFIKFVVDTRINALIVSSNVPKFIKVAANIIKELDIPTRQVLIEAKFIEVSLDKGHNLGIDWSQFNNVNVQTSSDVVSYNLQNWSPSYGSLDVKQFSLILKNLDSTANMNLLSSPRITTVDNKKAFIKIADNIIIGKTTTVTGGTTNNTFSSDERTDVGISLEVTPHINSDTYITLELSPQVNEARKSAISTGVDIIKREAFTTLIVENGGTVALGGLIKNSTNNTTAGVPFLSKIPLLNLFFGHRTNTVTKTELVIFITPTIITKSNIISEKEKEIFDRANNQAENLHIDVMDE